MKLILTRHGHVDGIDPPRFRGRVDLPLTALGMRQASQLGERVAAKWNPTAIYSGPLKRCTETARAVATACDLRHSICSNLNDLDYGAWQGLAYGDVAEKWPQLLRSWLATPHLVRFPGGESLQDLVARVADVLRALIQMHDQPDEIVMVVGHDSVNRALLTQVLDQPLSAYWRLAQSPCAITEIDIVDGHVQAWQVNAALP